MDVNAFEKSHQTNEDGKYVETIKKDETAIKRSGRQVKLNHHHPTHVHNTIYLENKEIFSSSFFIEFEFD